MTPSGIDPATFRFVVQCLNHCATSCPTRTDNNKELKSSPHDVIYARAVADTMWESNGTTVQVQLGTKPQNIIDSKLIF
jgi:hypothetical protein